MENKQKTDSTSTDYFYLYKYTYCPYLGNCKSEGNPCKTCGNNPDNQKQDYYTPKYPPYTFPYYNPPYITWSTEDNTETK